MQSIFDSKFVVLIFYTKSPDLTTWIRKNMIDEQTFPHFFTYFYPLSIWSYVVIFIQSKKDHTSVEKQLFLDTLSNKKHYKEILKCIYPNKISSSHITTYDDNINSIPSSLIISYETCRHAEDSISETSAFLSWCIITLNVEFLLWRSLL